MTNDERRLGNIRIPGTGGHTLTKTLEVIVTEIMNDSTRYQRELHRWIFSVMFVASPLFAFNILDEIWKKNKSTFKGTDDDISII